MSDQLHLVTVVVECDVAAAKELEVELRTVLCRFGELPRVAVCARLTCYSDVASSDIQATEQEIYEALRGVLDQLGARVRHLESRPNPLGDPRIDSREDGASCDCQQIARACPEYVL